VESEAFHRRVAQAYLRLAAENAGRYVIVDGMQPPQLIAEQAFQAVLERLYAMEDA
jgi:thymidylate kinase